MLAAPAVPLSPARTPPGPNCASGARTMPLQWHIKGAALPAAGTATGPSQMKASAPPGSHLGRGDTAGARCATGDSGDG